MIPSAKFRAMKTGAALLGLAVGAAASLAASVPGVVSASSESQARVGLGSLVHASRALPGVAMEELYRVPVRSQVLHVPVGRGRVGIAVTTSAVVHRVERPAGDGVVVVLERHRTVLDATAVDVLPAVIAALRDGARTTSVLLADVGTDLGAGVRRALREGGMMGEVPVEPSAARAQVGASCLAACTAARERAYDEIYADYFDCMDVAELAYWLCRAACAQLEKPEDQAACANFCWYYRDEQEWHCVTDRNDRLDAADADYARCKADCLRPRIEPAPAPAPDIEFVGVLR